MRKAVQILSVAAAAPATPAAAAPRANPDVELQRLLAGRVPGKPLNCIRLTAIRSSRIIEGRAIVYRAGGTMYLNEPGGANTLDDDDVLATRTSGSQLCRGDTVQLVNRASRIPHSFVILRRFVPFTRVR